MSRKLKYGQGTIHKRFRLTFVDEYDITQVKTTSDVKVVNQITAKYKCNLYVWYELKWYDEYGKRQGKSVSGTQPNGRPVNKEYARKVLAQYNKRSLRTLNKKEYIRFGVAMHQWYKEFRMDDAGPERNEHNIREINRLPKSTADKRLQDVTAQELQKHLNDMKHDNPRVTARYLLASFLNFMFLQGVLPKDIGKLLKAPMARRAEKQTLTMAMEPEFLELLPEKFRKYAIGLIYTGCRYTEFINIRAEDVDRENNVIMIRNTKPIRANDRRQGIMYKPRLIPLLPQVAELNFPLPYISQAYFQKCFQTASAKLGIKVTPHDMRHTFATRCDDFGVKEKVIQKILGHTSPRMTRHYKNHTTEELLDYEFNRIRVSGEPIKQIPTATIVAEAHRIQQEEIPTLTNEDEQRFIAAFPERYYDFLVGLIYTGCKYGELIRITEEDIDRANKTIFIQETKMGSGATPARTIPLLPQVEQIKFPLPELSKKLFVNIIHEKAKKLRLTVNLGSLSTVFQDRYTEFKSTTISTTIGG